MSPTSRCTPRTPQLLSVMRGDGDLGIEELERTSYSRFRSTSDVAPASTLHHHWAIATGRAVPADYSFRYVQLGTPDMRRRLARLAAGEDVDFFCLNDVDTAPADPGGGPGGHPRLPRTEVSVPEPLRAGAPGPRRTRPRRAGRPGAARPRGVSGPGACPVPDRWTPPVN
ncbi:stealth conserved region 3 domain-containing protein [Streptomyces tricolor]|nr:stealth conserved region 3 domain-containing protein [Streptomyces tricolor]